MTTTLHKPPASALAALSRALPVAGPKLVVIGLLAIVIAVGCVVNDRFATAQNVSNVLGQAAVLGLVSIGQTLVVLVGGIDLSVGAIASASTVALAAVAGYQESLTVPALLGVLALGLLIGVTNGMITTRLGVHPLIVTIGTTAVVNGLTLLYTLQPTGSIPSWLEDFAYGEVLGLPVSGLVMLLLFLVLAIFLKTHQFGRHVYAVGDDAEAARLNGIPVHRVTIIAYAVAGLLAALAGVFLTARTGTGDPLAGESLALASITPVVVGGTRIGGGSGGLLGTFLGVLLVSFLSNALNYIHVSAQIQWVVQGLLIILAVIFLAEKENRR